MPELNSTFLSEIKLALNGSSFSEADFDLNDDQYGELLKIKFKYDSKYTLIVKEEDVSEKITTGSAFGLKTKGFTTNVTKLYSYESPGEYKIEDKIEISGFSRLPARIATWCQNIHREISHEGSLNSNLEKEKEEFRDSIALDVNEPLERFTPDQIGSISKKMDELYNKFSELSKQYEVSEGELESLKKEFEVLKSNAKTFKQGMWAKVTENKITQFVFEFLKSKEGRSLIIDTIKKIGN